jgi:CheY-like chemotaxis protein
VLYATGAGQTVPGGIDGSVAAHARIADYPAPEQPVQVTVGGEPAEIAYVGAAPHSVAGLLQVNFRVPVNAPLGDSVPLVLKVGSFRSPGGVTMAVRSPTAQILVIASQPAIRNWLGTVLKAAGYQVLTRRNSREALTQASRHRIDLVISDLTISSPRRQEAILAIRADRPRIAVIATTRALGPVTIKAADLLGAQAIFTEPLRSKAVVRRVRELLRSRPVSYVAAEEAR